MSCKKVVKLSKLYKHHPEKISVYLQDIQFTACELPVFSYDKALKLAMKHGWGINIVKTFYSPCSKHSDNNYLKKMWLSSKETHLELMEVKNKPFSCFTSALGSTWPLRFWLLYATKLVPINTCPVEDLVNVLQGNFVELLPSSIARALVMNVLDQIDNLSEYPAEVTASLKQYLLAAV